jgi:hypothetical protein
MPKSTTYVSLGYRCSTAGILKRLGKKHESYPFDWMISRLPIVQHCIETRFRYFIDPQYYTEKSTHTTHYHEGTTPTPLKICDETIYANHYYQTLYSEYTKRIPQPLSINNGDTYAHLCAMNHRDIRTQETQEYYQRCIDRFYRQYENKNEKTMGLYIHPAITEEEYAVQKEELLDEFREFYEQVLNPTKWLATFFIMVRTSHPYPITDYKPNVLVCVYENATMRIYVVYTNRDFIDAGEIFMQNAYIETDKMCELIESFSV